MNAQLKPRLPKSYGWSHSLKDHQPLPIEFDQYAQLIDTFLKQEGMIEHLRRNCPGQEIIIGVSMGLESVYVETFDKGSVNPKSDLKPFPNHLRLALFRVNKEGPKLLNSYSAARVMCTHPTLTTFRLLKPAEAAVSRFALNTFNFQER